MFDSAFGSSVDAAIDVATSRNLDTYSAQDLLDQYEGLHKAIERLSFEAARTLAAIDERSAFATASYTSTSSFVAHRCRIRAGHARRRVANARGLTRMPTVAKLAAEGVISTDQITVLVEARNAAPEVFDDHEPGLADVAIDLPMVRDFQRAIDYWKQAAIDPPDGLEEQCAQSYLHISETMDGMVKIDALIDKERGARLISALRRATPPPTINDQRSAMQRRLDAFIELVDREPVNTKPTAARLAIHIDWDTLTGQGVTLAETDNGTVLPRSVIDRIACGDITIGRIIYGPDSQILDYGRTERLVPPHLRNAILAKFRECVIGGCDRPAQWLDLHHIIPWSQGGPTNEANIIAPCRHHHTAIHNGNILVKGNAHNTRFYRRDGTPLRQ